MSAASGGRGEWAALHRAAASGDAAACGRLLATKSRGSPARPYDRDELGRTPLHVAAANGHAATVRLLLNAATPEEVDAVDGAGCAALQRAASEGHEDVLRVLLAGGADANRRDAVHGNTALHEASWKGFSRTVRMLASSSASLDLPNAGGFTPLHLCCQNGHNQTCRELLLAGCETDVKNGYGDTPLHTASRYGHAGVTRILISAQCKVSEQNKNGDTALHIAAAMGRRKLTRILIEAGSDRKVRNKQHETARDIAARKELFEIVDILDAANGVVTSREKKSVKSKKEKSKKSKVRFDGKNNTTAGPELDPKVGHWSPYGCHYYPDPEAFPSPRLDSLPPEPLKRGEQYYLDLAGNIRKGPVGVGYTCYCAPLFRHLEARLERDRREVMKAQQKLGQRVAGLEQKINRGVLGRRSERLAMNAAKDKKETMQRSRSLEMLDKMDKPVQLTRSMDELENDDKSDQKRPSVKELVARIQQKQQSTENSHLSESSEDEDREMNGQSFTDAPPRTRSALYESDLPPPENTAEQQSSINYYLGNYPSSSSTAIPPTRFIDLNSRFAKLRVLDHRLSTNGSQNVHINGVQETYVDRDTNNDSGYSTKVYGSSKGNSPSLSGKIDPDCAAGPSHLGSGLI